MNRIFFILVLMVFFPSERLFAQNINYDVPDRYSGKITADDYRKIVDQSVQIVASHSKITEVKDGVIFLEVDKHINEMGLDNVILKCLLANDRSLWNDIVSAHFKAIYLVGEEVGKINIDDFQSIKSLLSIRIYPDNFFNGDVKKVDVISRVDLEGTKTVLMLDLPSTFQTLKPSNAIKYHVKDDELFKIAQQNISKQQVKKVSQKFNLGGPTEIELNMMENEDYCASYALDLEHNAPEFIGDLGCAVAFPNKGFVTSCKISREQPLDFVKYIQRTKELIDKSFETQPGAISNDFYWYYKGKYTKINVLQNANGELTVISPIELNTLLGKK